MALEVKRKEKENAQGLIRRFTQRMQKSGILIRARKNRYKKDQKSSGMQKKGALRKIELTKEYEKLKKIRQKRKIMSLKRKIKNEIKEALKNHEEVKLLVLRGLISAMNNKEIEKWTKISKSGEQKNLEEKSKLSEEEESQTVFSEVKKRKESILEFSVYGGSAVGREKEKIENAIKKEKTELEILQKYLPEQMSEDEIKKLARESIEKLGAKEMKDMGKVLRELMPKVKGKAEGSQISQIVKDLLTK